MKLFETVRKLFHVINLLVSVCTPQEIIFHENYGVFFKHEGVLETTQESWHQTFVVDITTPEIPQLGFHCTNEDVGEQSARSGSEIQTSGMRCNHPDWEKQCPTTTSNGTTPRRKETHEILCPVFRSYFDQHKYLLSSIHDVIEQTDTLLPITQKRTRRALVNVVGSISRSLFGTATVHDKHMLQRHIRHVEKRVDLVQGEVTQLGDALESYMVQNNRQTDLLVEAIIRNNQEINATRAEVEENILALEQEFFTYIKSLHLSGSQLTQALSDTHRILKERLNGVETLLKGYLPQNLIKPMELKKAIEQIKTQLLAYDGFTVTHDNHLYYYHIPDITYTRFGDRLYIKLKVPVTSTANLFDVYKLSSIPIAIGTDRNEVTEFSLEDSYVAISRNNQFYVTMSENEYEYCSGNQYKRCDNLMVVRETEKPNCMLALFKGDAKLIYQHCEIQIARQASESKVISIKPGKYFVSSNEVMWTQLCPRSIPKHIKACNHCVVTVPCGCSLRGENIFIPPALDTCSTSSEVNIEHSVNLPALIEFYKNSRDVFNITSRTGFANRLDTKLPRFDLISHQFDDVVHKIAKQRYSLRKIAHSTSKRSKIYATVPDRILETSGLFARQGMDLVTFTFLVITFVVSFMAFLLSVRNLRVLALVRTVSGSFDFLRTTTPETNEFSYSADDVQSLVKTISLVTILVAMCLLAFGTIYVAKKLYKRHHRNQLVDQPIHTKIFLSVYGKGRAFVKEILITPLEGKELEAFGTESFRKPTFCPSVLGVGGKIVLNWNESEFRHKSTGSKLSLPSQVEVSMFDSYVRGLLENVSAVRVVAVYDHKYYDLFTWYASRKKSIEIEQKHAYVNSVLNDEEDP